MDAVTKIQGYLASPQQRTIWLRMRDMPPERFTVSVVALVDGALELNAVRRAHAALSATYEILRTRFFAEPGMTFPLQVIDHQSDGNTIEIRVAIEKDSKLVIRALADEARRRTFQPSEGALHWTCLVRLAPDRHVVATAQSALIADTTGALVFVDQLVRMSRGAPAGEQEEAVQYVDLAQWYNDVLSNEEGAAGRAFWAAIKWLPTTRRRSLPDAAPASQVVRREVGLAAALVRLVDELAGKLGVQRQAVILAAWSILLARLTGAKEIPIACLLNGRTDDALLHLPGRLERDVPIIIEVPPDQTAEELVLALNERMSTATRWQECFAWEHVGATKSAPAHRAAFAFAWRERPGNTEIRPCLIEDASMDFELRLVGEDDVNGFGVAIEHGHRVDSAPWPRDIDQPLAALLADMSIRSSLPIGELALLDTADVRQSDLCIAGPGIDFDAPSSFGELVFERLARHATATALICEDRAFTYAELDRRARSLAWHVQQRAVGKGSVIALFLPRSPEYVVAALAVLAVGGIFLPLDPGFPDRRLNDIAADARPAAIITTESLRLRAGALGIPQIVLVDLDRADEQTVLPVATAPDAPAYLMYTSGSTGRPKGVVVPHRALRNFLLWSAMEMPLGHADRVLFRAAISFDAAIWEMFAPLLDGAAVVVVPGTGAGTTDEIGRLLRQANISVLKTTPSLLGALLDADTIQPAAALRLVLCGAETLVPALADRFYATGTVAKLFNMYGPTEACIDVAFRPVGAGEAGRSVPIGRPIANVRMYVFDQRMRPLPRGFAGELCIGGLNLALGYHQSPEADRRAFVADPFCPGERLFRSGDLARLNLSGEIEFLGRSDHQVKVRGARVELEEVEIALATHPGVGRCAARVVTRGGSEQLVAYVAATSGSAKPDVQDLRAFVAARLPDYMVPALFVLLDAIPLNTSGKVDRMALPDPMIASGDRTKYVAPRNSTEAKLAAIWARVLRIDKVGIEDDFFDLGGDSILSVQVVAQAAQDGLTVTVRQLFDRRTIAAIVDALGVAPKVVAEQGLVLGPMPLMPVQKRFLAREIPDVHHFNQSMLFELEENADIDAIKRAMPILLDHHDALRIRLKRDSNSWHQEIVAPEDVDILAVCDLSQVEDAGQRRARLEAIAQEAQSSLDLEAGPIIRAIVFRQPRGEVWRMLFVCHHMGIDGVSWRVFLEDFSAIYCALKAKDQPRLPPKTTSFAEWARRIEEIGRRHLVRSQASYWLNEARLTVPALPLDSPKSAAADTIAETSSFTVRLDEIDTRTLLQVLPRTFGTQINDVLLTALVGAIEAWTGQATLVADVDAHGREELFEDVNLSRTIGWFTTVYPLFLKTEPGEAPLTRLRSVSDQLKKVPDRGISYGILRYGDASPDLAAQLAAVPPAQISFNYLGQLDQVISLPPLLGWASEACGHTQCPQAVLQHVIELNAFVVASRFEMQWTHGRSLLPATVETIANRYIAELVALIRDAQRASSGTPS